VDFLLDQICRGLLIGRFANPPELPNQSTC